jgi:hypothetical protein
MKHLTSDKVNSRAEGRREIRTHQPTGGRGNEGGMRIGEMERDAVLAHGVSLFLQESMMKRADATFFWVCNGCGTIPINNERENLFVCPTCDGPVEFSGSTAETMTLIQPLKRSRVTFSKVEMPYALKLLDQELTTFMGAGMRFVTSKSVGRLREDFLDWDQERSVGGGSPGPPNVYTETVKHVVPLEVKPLIKDSRLPGPEKETIYIKPEELSNPILEKGPTVETTSVLGEIGNERTFVIANPNLEPKILESNGTNEISPLTSYPIKDAGIEIPQMGGNEPTNIIGFNDHAPLKLIDLLSQEGGVAPVSSIGQDTVPVKHNLEEEWVVQQGGKQDALTPKSILKQSGGAPIALEPEVKFEIPGTEIEAKIFGQPALSEEPYVVANPFVSPPLTGNEPKLGDAPIGIVQAPAQQVDEVKIFENADIRVIKLQ